MSRSGEAVSTSTSKPCARSSSTPASAIVSRTSTFTGAALSNNRHGLLERLECGDARDPALEIRAEMDERQLESCERSHDVEDVEPADVADPDRLALQLALPRGKRNAVVVAQVSQQLVGVDPLRHADRRDDRGRVVVRREELEPHRLRA